MALSVVYATVNGELVEETRDGVTTTYVSDTLGSVIQTRSAAGTQTSSTTYWPFGEVRTSTGSNPSPWGFCGAWGYFKDAINRLYVRARILKPDLSRWLTVDPFWPGERAYGYVRNSPGLLIDPIGAKPATQICRDCPSIVDKLWGNLDLDLFGLWADVYLGSDAMKRINNCIQNSARSWGVRCSQFDWNTLNCLKNSSFFTPVACSDCKDHPTWCAYTEGEYPNSRIVICWPKVTSPGCGNYGLPGQGVSHNLWITLLHELLHSCGFDHGTEIGTGGEPPAKNSCNEIAACCVRRVMTGSDTNKCRKP